MISSKGSHRIRVGDCEYRWSATGNDGWINVVIWPVNNIGALMGASLNYHSTGNLDQIVITNRIVKRVIEYAIREHLYDPNVVGKQLHMGSLDSVIQWNDAIRATRK